MTNRRCQITCGMDKCCQNAKPSSMLDIFLRTLPFFAVLGLGFFAAKRDFFNASATAALTKFVFFFALPAMIFRFAASLPLEEVFHMPSVLAYFSATVVLYCIVTTVALIRGTGVETAAIEAQSATIGNVGFLAVPMLLLLMGDAAIGPVMIVLAVDLVFFGSLVVIIISAKRDGRMSPAVLKSVAIGLLRNPMVMAMCLGLLWAGLSIPVPTPADDFLTLLGAAATPGAMFAIGASLAAKNADRPGIALWLSFTKLILHPLAVVATTLYLFDIPAFSAAVIIAAAAMPTAGNVYIIAQHYGIAPLRASTTILFSTIASILTLTLVIAWVSG